MFLFLYRFWSNQRRLMACPWNVGLWVICGLRKWHLGLCFIDYIRLQSLIVSTAWSCTSFNMFDVETLKFRSGLTHLANLCTICTSVKSTGLHVACRYLSPDACNFIHFSIPSSGKRRVRWDVVQVYSRSPELIVLLINKKLSYRRETARRFVSLNNFAKSLEVIRSYTVA